MLTRAHLSVSGRRRVLGALSLATVVVTAGCGGSSGASPEPQPSASAAEKPGRAANAQDATERKVRAAYSSFWREQVKAYAKGSTKGTGIENYATGEALEQLDSDVARMNARGDRNKGAPQHDATVELEPKQDGKVGSATISDCLDISTWKTVDKQSGKAYPLPTAQPRRAITTVKAEDWGKKGWMILKVTPSTTKC